MSTSSSGGACSKEVYTEEIPISPTPHLPGARFHLSGGLPPPAKNKGKGTVETLTPSSRAMTSWTQEGSTCDEEGSRGKEKSKSKKVVPVPRVHYPFPVSAEDGSAGTGVLTSPREHESERERNVTLSLHGVFPEDL
ncbi:hypothetical protein DFH08DRAFT_950183 [Mycena albidolilacea]|uniref:Uncharacterized protein n=1 Tax=Mycena albidolilacea TaxID=1033008 RepID=A0AAD7APG1_9AGAR|nr:hypothetical protein DFH08DRAFT_950183 [Mycena albidolilacea]